VRSRLLPQTTTGGDDGADEADAVGVLSAEGSPNPITAIPPASSATAAT
jgi:hypothetical protein